MNKGEKQLDARSALTLLFITIICQVFTSNESLKQQVCTL